MPTTTKTLLLVALLLITLAAALAWIAPRDFRGVVVYTSVDADDAKALAKRFEEATGIAVELRTDSESNKTTGMLGRLRQLSARPDGDVFWNSELSGTMLLARDGILEPYRSPHAAGIPDSFKDPGGQWTGFGLRARVLIINTQRVSAAETPATLEELCEPKWRGRFCLARPLYGTTRSHLAWLVIALGEERGWALLRRLRENARPDGKWIVDGNAAVRERVCEGVFDVGLTDTDDVYAALDRQRPVRMALCGQTADLPGVFLIPNTVALLKGGPHPETARKFVDFLLQPETEAWLAQQGARQIPVRAEVAVPGGCLELKSLPRAAVDLEQLRERIEPLSERIDKILSGIEP